MPAWRTSNGLRRGRAKAQNGERKEHGADHSDKNKLRPDHVEAGAAVQNACANDTKCVDGEARMMVASQCGMLSSGVLLPESRFIGRKININNKPSCGMVRATVPKNIPMAQVKNR